MSTLKSVETIVEAGVYDVTFCDGKWITWAAVYEGHTRGKNWAARVKRDHGKPGGLDRAFLAPSKAPGACYNMDGLVPLDIVEYGADYYASGGKKHPARAYALVVAVNATSIRLAVYPKFEAATEARNVLELKLKEEEAAAAKVAEALAAAARATEAAAQDKADAVVAAATFTLGDAPAPVQELPTPTPRRERLRHAHDLRAVELADTDLLPFHWAFVDDGVPAQVVFLGLLPYSGFRYSVTQPTQLQVYEANLRGEEHRPFPHVVTETRSPAYFADSLEDLVLGTIARWDADVRRTQEFNASQAKKLLELLPREPVSSVSELVVLCEATHPFDIRKFCAVKQEQAVARRDELLARRAALVIELNQLEQELARCALHGL
jgi:hypothetical protein